MSYILPCKVTVIMKLSSVTICLVLLCFLCGWGNALMIYENESQLIRNSDQIVYGRIVDIKSAWNAQKTHIETTAQVLVDEAFVKSDNTSIFAGTTIPVTVLGGTVGDLSEWVEDMPVFELNSDTFIYLEKTNSGKFTVHGLYKGIHPVVSDNTGSLKDLKTSSSSASAIAQFKEEINQTLRGVPVEVHPPGLVSGSLSAIAAASGPTISSITPSSASAGTNIPVTITGSGFGSTHATNAHVRFFKSLNSYDPLTGNINYAAVLATTIDSWSDTRIVARVPMYASSGFAVVRTDSNIDSNVFPVGVTFGFGDVKWTTSPTFYVNPGSVSGATTAITNAAVTWNNTGSSFRFNYGGTTSSMVVADDSINTIFFGPSTDFLSENTIALTTCTYWVATKRIFDCDLEFNNHFTWTTGFASGSTMNVESVALHEFGHWLRLTDLYGDLPQNGVPGGFPSDLSPDMKKMYGIAGDSIGNMNLKTLASADIEGIRWIYPGSSAPTVTSITPGIWCKYGTSLNYEPHRYQLRRRGSSTPHPEWLYQYQCLGSIGCFTDKNYLHDSSLRDKCRSVHCYCKKS